MNCTALVASPRTFARMGGHRRVKRTFHKGQELRLTIEDMAFGGKASPVSRRKKALSWCLSKTPSRPSGGRPSGQVQSASCRMSPRGRGAADFEVDLPYQPIPGAPYATVPMEKQHEWKARTALDLYRKIGEVEDLDTLYQGFVPSPLIGTTGTKWSTALRSDTTSRRTKRWTTSLIQAPRHVVAVENLDADSGLFDALVESTLHKVREWCEATGLPAWHPPSARAFSASWWCERVMRMTDCSSTS